MLEESQRKQDDCTKFSRITLFVSASDLELSRERRKKSHFFDLPIISSRKNWEIIIFSFPQHLIS